MRIGTKGVFFLYDDDTFNCPACKWVNFKTDWEKFYVADGEQFKMPCANTYCPSKLVVYRQDGIIHVATARLYYLNQTKRKPRKNGKKDIS